MQLDFSHLPRSEKILVACSGGGDSVALLLALHRAEYSCVVAHVNHGTRGEESEDDEKFVREVCEQLKLDFVSTRLKFETQKPSEAAMRDARYAALQGLAREYSCARVATGHSADDVLETILLNWIRGATVSGFSGIAPLRELPNEVLLVRPMLQITREEAHEFLISHGWKWREDASNQSAQFLRNRVRSELLPVLSSLCGDESTQRLAKQSARAAQIARDDLEFLNAEAGRALGEIKISGDENCIVLDGSKWKALPVALQRRVLRLAAQSLCEEARDVELEKIEATRAQITQNQRRAVWQWRKNLRVEWTGEYSGNRIRLWRV